MGWVDRPGATTVEIEIDADESGSLVTLTHRDLPDEEIQPRTAGWRHYVVRLGAAAKGKDLEPDQGPSGRAPPSRGVRSRSDRRSAA